jgi:hypothetical protein
MGHNIPSIKENKRKEKELKKMLVCLANKDAVLSNFDDDILSELLINTLMRKTKTTN